MFNIMAVSASMFSIMAASASINTNNPGANGNDAPANPAVYFVMFVDLSTGELTAFSKS